MSAAGIDRREFLRTSGQVAGALTIAFYVGPFTAVSHLAAFGASAGLLRAFAGIAGDSIGLPAQPKGLSFRCRPRT